MCTNINNNLWYIFQNGGANETHLLSLLFYSDEKFLLKYNKIINDFYITYRCLKYYHRLYYFMIYIFFNLSQIGLYF